MIWVWARRCRPWPFLLRYWGARGLEGQIARRGSEGAARRGEPPDPDRAPALVLAPTSLLEGWKRELAKYTLLNVSVAKTGAEAAQAARDAKHGARDVLVTTHSLAKNLTDSGPDRWSCVIVGRGPRLQEPRIEKI